MLVSESATQLVPEGNDFIFDIETMNGFPLVPSDYQWLFNGIQVPSNSLNPNVSAYPNITFTNISRNDSGNYSITITNEAGTTNGYFLLDVQCKLVACIICSLPFHS